jgi:hypothetical protein
MTLISGEPGDLDEINEDDAWREFEHLWKLRPFEEIDGAILLDWQIEDLIETVYENPPLPGSYKLPASYIAYIISRKRALHNWDTDYLFKKEEPSDSFNQTKLIQARLKLNPKFSKLLGQSDLRWYHRLLFVKFRIAKKVANTFLTDTILTRGIYPNTFYDYDRYFKKSHFYSSNLEYMLMSESPRKQKWFFRGSWKTSRKAELKILCQMQPNIDLEREYRLVTGKRVND